MADPEVLRRLKELAAGDRPRQGVPGRAGQPARHLRRAGGGRTEPVAGLGPNCQSRGPPLLVPPPRSPEPDRIVLRGNRTVHVERWRHFLPPSRPNRPIIPYHGTASPPVEAQPLPRSTIPAKSEPTMEASLLIGEDIWNLVGGEGTYGEIIRIAEEVGLSYRSSTLDHVGIGQCR